MTEPDRAALAPVTDVVAVGVSRLTAVFSRPKTTAILTALLAEVQAAEDAVWSLAANTSLDTAEDAALDQLGRILDAVRPVGFVDDDYREVLRAAVLANRSSGTGPELIGVMEALTGGLDFTLTEGVATVLIEPDGALAFGAAVVIEYLRRAKAGGVALQLIVPPTGAAFTFGTDPEVPEVDADRGWSDTDQLVGGQLVGVVE